jgi:hypothetical protein
MGERLSHCIATNNGITQSACKNFCGVSGCAIGGPNGVWTVNHKEIWAGDGDSTVKVLDASGALLKPAISTGARSCVAALQA